MSNETKEISDKIKKCLIAGYDVNIITQDELNILWNYITNLQQEKDDYKSRVEKAIEELFELKDMIYKPETREENFPIQRKISKIIINLGGKDE